MKKTKTKNRNQHDPYAYQSRVRWAITITAAILSILHMFTGLTIDTITAILAGVAFLPWIAPIIKSVDLPGGGKITFSDMEKIEAKAKISGLISAKIEHEEKPKDKDEQFLNILASKNPNLALASIRVEIERTILNIAQRKGVDTSRQRSLAQLVSFLREKEVFSESELAAIKALIPILNKAVHGAKIDSNNLEWAIRIGSEIISGIQKKDIEFSIKDTLLQWQNRDGGMFVEVGDQLTKIFLNSPNEFSKAMSDDSKSFKEWLEGLETISFTNFCAQEKAEAMLEIAKMEKLKELMLENCNLLKKTPFTDLAQKIEQRLNEIKPRNIQ